MILFDDFLLKERLGGEVIEIEKEALKKALKRSLTIFSIVW
jgi:hypothetical protein